VSVVKHKCYDMLCNMENWVGAWARFRRS
jgi:hypothetical protein